MMDRFFEDEERLPITRAARLVRHNPHNQCNAMQSRLAAYQLFRRELSTIYPIIIL